PCVVSHTLLFLYPDLATPALYTLSLHDALPIYPFDVQVHVAGLDQEEDRPHLPHRRVLLRCQRDVLEARIVGAFAHELREHRAEDRKSTRLNSSHEWISYAVFCLKKKKKTEYQI